jgi:hypothetical protein
MIIDQHGDLLAHKVVDREPCDTRLWKRKWNERFRIERVWKVLSNADRLWDVAQRDRSVPGTELPPLRPMLAAGACCLEKTQENVSYDAFREKPIG